MTCDEFYHASGTMPDKFTRAERAAVYAHYFSCLSCRRRFDAEAAEAEKKVPPRLAREVAEAADELFDRDIQDPEFRNVASPEGRD